MSFLAVGTVALPQAVAPAVAGVGGVSGAPATHASVSSVCLWALGPATAAWLVERVTPVRVLVVWAIL